MLLYVTPVIKALQLTDYVWDVSIISSTNIK